LIAECDREYGHKIQHLCEMTYTHKPPYRFFLSFWFFATCILWIIVVLMLTGFQRDGGPISDDLKLYLILPSILISFLVVRHYIFMYRYER
jgi:hypothetical protein